MHGVFRTNYTISPQDIRSLTSDNISITVNVDNQPGLTGVLRVVDGKSFAPLIGRGAVHLRPVKVDPDLEGHLVGDDGGGGRAQGGVGEVGAAVPVRAGAGPRCLTSARDRDPVLAATLPDLGDGGAGAGRDLADLEGGGGETGVGDAAVALLCSDTEVVLLVGQVETLPVVVGVEDPGGAREVLQTPGRRSPVSRAADLHHLDLPLGLQAGVPGEGQLVAGRLLPGLQDHVEAGVGATDDWRTGTLSLRREPGLDAAAPTVGISVPRVGRARPGDDEIIKVEPAVCHQLSGQNFTTVLT